MPLLASLVKTVGRALGLPSLVSTGIKRTTARLLTFGLKQIGFDISGIQHQAEQLFKAPASRDVKRTISMTAERMDLMNKVSDFVGDLPFSREFMFETSFRNDRNYRYFGYVNMLDRGTGDIQSQWISFYGNDNMSKDEIADAFEAEIMKKLYGESYELQSYQIMEVWHNQGKPY